MAAPPVVSAAVTTAAAASGGLLAEALLGGYPAYAKGPATPASGGPATPDKSKENNNNNSSDDLLLPLGASFETAGQQQLGGGGSLSPASNSEEPVNIELDNAGRVKSGKVLLKGHTVTKMSADPQFYSSPVSVNPHLSALINRLKNVSHMALNPPKYSIRKLGTLFPTG
jgi:hypothetical protein